MNRLLINGAEVTEKDLFSGEAVTSHAMVGETLSADQINFVVNTEDQPFYPADQDYPLITADHHVYFSRNAIDMLALHEGDNVLYYDGETLAGKYFFESMVQQGSDRYKITAVSIIGRLLNSRHYGGIYTVVQASEIYADILSGSNYVLDPDVAAATVTGYLPIASRRDNLQQLLMATGATIWCSEDGTIYISAMSSVPAGVFTADRVFIGGKIKTNRPVSGVKVTEHNYFPAGNVVTLFEDGVDGEELIEFGAPYHDLSIEGGTILESGVNYARISALGTVTLTGQPYTHVTRIVTAGVVGASSTENVKNVSSCYLANPQIAQALAERLYSYLQCNQTISQDVLTGTERAGNVVSVINPYTLEMETATIKSFDVSMSGVNKAKAEFLLGFVPSGVLSGFTSYEMLTGSGTWAVPDGVAKIRIILVGGGSGGDGGQNGSDGGSASVGGTSSGGSGGSGGAAGAGGKVFEISLDVTAGESFDFACGAAGVGGAIGEDGTDGAATTFGGYSSDYGRLYPYGYYEARTGLTMAAAGADGYDGGDGGDGSPDYGSGGEKGKDGESVETYTGGAGGYCYTDYIDPDGRHYYDYGGAGGGGAAYGANGGTAQNSTPGVGATAIAGENGTNPGQGGGGGHGGGGGGGGALWYHHNALSDTYDTYTGDGGSGGSGAKGGNGVAGAIIIYY